MSRCADLFVILYIQTSKIILNSECRMLGKAVCVKTSFYCITIVYLVFFVNVRSAFKGKGSVSLYCLYCFIISYFDYLHTVKANWCSIAMIVRDEQSIIYAYYRRIAITLIEIILEAIEIFCKSFQYSKSIIRSTIS